MRDPKRIPQIIIEVNRLWHTCSDMRFGQLIDNLYTQYYYDIGEPLPKDFFYTEDDEFLEWLKTFKGW